MSPLCVSETPLHPLSCGSLQRFFFFPFFLIASELLQKAQVTEKGLLKAAQCFKKTACPWSDRLLVVLMKPDQSRQDKDPESSLIQGMWGQPHFEYLCLKNIH